MTQTNPQTNKPTAEENAIALFRPEAVSTLSQLAPSAYNDNRLSHTRCLDAGQALLNLAEQGMTDDLDQQIARYLEKAKATLRKMNSRRTPVTQLFDRIRREYTNLENQVDPAKSGTIPAQLQALRDQYARQKHEAEQRRIREELLRQQAEADRAQYRADVETDLIRRFDNVVTKNLIRLAAIESSLTLDNYDMILKTLQAFPVELPADCLADAKSTVPRPATLTAADADAIQAEVKAALAQRFREQYPYEVRTTRDDIADRLPSRREELQRMAQADAEEAEQIKARLIEQQLKEKQRREAERAQRLEQQQSARQLEAQRREMDSLFGAPVAQPVEYQPKTRLRKKAVISSADDIMRIVAYWWSQEGCTHTLDDLRKEFRKQITFANNAANAKSGATFIDGITYEDDIKAK